MAGGGSASSSAARVGLRRRLFDLRNAIDAFRVTKDAAVAKGGHHSGAGRWKDDTKPTGGADEEASEEAREAAAAVKKLQEKAARLRSAKDVTTRLNEAQAAQKMAEKLRSQLPANAAGANGTAAAGCKLRSLWPAAAMPARRSFDGEQRDVGGEHGAEEAAAARSVASPRRHRGAARRQTARREAAREAAAARGGPPAAGPFDKMSNAESMRRAAHART